MAVVETRYVPDFQSSCAKVMEAAYDRVQSEDLMDDLQSNSAVPASVSSGTSATVSSIASGFPELFSENVVSKIWRVAVREREFFENQPPTAYPEYVTISGLAANRYTLREADFWTCGFFPGSLYALLERCMRFPQQFPIPIRYRSTFQAQLLDVCSYWTNPIRAMDSRIDTHDMSFIIMPSLRMDYELTSNAKSLRSVITAAESLATRWSDRVGAIRSWDEAINDRYTFTDTNEDFLVIIDSMCNLDLLYYAGHHAGNQHLIDIATRHAHTVLRAVVRDDWSTYHLINFDAKTGAVKNQLTNQGHKDWSTWSRGQAWAILGFAQTYHWTQDETFLSAALGCTSYFLSRLAQSASSGTHTHPYVPLWDFDASPTPSPTAGSLRDTSAGMIAVNGLLLLQQSLTALRRTDEAASLLDVALRIMRETVDLSLANETAHFVVDVPPKEAKYPVVEDEKAGEGFDAILRHATANNNEHAHKRYADHGLVYADYYFLEAGNKLLRMGLV